MNIVYKEVYLLPMQANSISFASIIVFSKISFNHKEHIIQQGRMKQLELIIYKERYFICTCSKGGKYIYIVVQKTLGRALNGQVRNSTSGLILVQFGVC